MDSFEYKSKILAKFKSTFRLDNILIFLSMNFVNIQAENHSKDHRHFIDACKFSHKFVSLDIFHRFQKTCK